MKEGPLDNFFQPSSIAVIGASEKTDSVGRVLITNLQQGGFSGKIYPINPNFAEIMGLPAFASVSRVNSPIDLALIAIPILEVPGVIRECGQAGITAAIIISTGGQEISGAGESIEVDIAREADKAGIRYLGPNSHGILCPSLNLNAGLFAYGAKTGNLAVVSQSRAICNTLLGWAGRKNIGFSHFISIGSMGDLDFGDLIDFLGNEEKIKCIILYMESLTQHRKFMSAARSVSRVKPIIVLKAGSSHAGTLAAASHTGVIASEDAAYSAAFRRAGIIRVKTITQLFDCAESLGKMKRPLGGALGIVTNSGGHGVMAVDAISAWNLEPAALSPETVGKLAEVLPSKQCWINPVDLLGNADQEDYIKAIRVCMAAPELSGLIVIMAVQVFTDPIGIARAIAAELVGKGRPAFAVWLGGPDVDEGLRILNEAGIPTFETPEQAVDTFMEMYFYTRHLELLQETPPRMTRDLQVNTRQAHDFIEHCLERNILTLSELESKAILSAYGIPFNPTVAASTPGDAAAVAEEIGYPVVLKINSPDPAPKSDRRGIRFYLRDQREVIAAYQKMTEEISAAYPEANIMGVTVQAQEHRPDLELFIGSTKDPDFGPLILFGLGGVFTEVMKDWQVDLPPLNLLLARRLIQKTRIFKLLQGYRHIPPANLDLLAEILVRISQLTTDFPQIVELELNPLVLTQGRAVAVDARLVLEPCTVPAPRHIIISPYPNHYETYWMLRDGTPILLRPIRPEDEPLIYKLLRQCSEQTIYFRYFHVVRKFSHEMLVRFTQIDYDREIALVAFQQPPAPEAILGVVRLVMTPQRETGEFAVIVGDPWQGRGLGPKLMERIIEISREQGVKHLCGDVLIENQPMLEVVKKLGFTLKKNLEEGIYRVEMMMTGDEGRETRQ